MTGIDPERKAHTTPENVCGKETGKTRHAQTSNSSQIQK
jgi:hypothetical protein